MQKGSSVNPVPVSSVVVFFFFTEEKMTEAMEEGMEAS